jgi:hypothetical protein
MIHACNRVNTHVYTCTHTHKNMRNPGRITDAQSSDSYTNQRNPACIRMLIGTFASPKRHLKKGAPNKRHPKRASKRGILWLFGRWVGRPFLARTRRTWWSGSKRRYFCGKDAIRARNYREKSCTHATLVWLSHIHSSSKKIQGIDIQTIRNLGI